MRNQMHKLIEYMECRDFSYYQALLALVCFLGTLFFPPLALVGGLHANPVAVPQLQLDSFNSNAYQGHFEQMNYLARDVDSWVAFAGEVFGEERALWESEADYQIQTHVNGVTQSDVYNGVANYKDYLLKELESQKEQALLMWEEAANIEINLQLRGYVDYITTGIYRLTETQNDQNQQSTEASASDRRLSQSQIREAYERNRERWESEYQQNSEQGSKEYADSLARMGEEYNRFNEQLDSQDLKFQENLAKIQEYKENVINGVNDTLTGMKDFLDHPANAELFGASNARTTAGAGLQTLIANFQGTLDSLGNQDFSFVMTQLASLMTNYLQTQTTQATITQQGFQRLSYVNYTNTNRHEGSQEADPYFNGLNKNGATVIPIGLTDYPQSNMIFERMKGNRTDAQVVQYFNTTFPGFTPYTNGNPATPPTSGRYISKILSMNLFGYTPPSGYPGWPPYYSNVQTDTNFAQNGEGFRKFVSYKICGGINQCADAFDQAQISYRIAYQITDTAMIQSSSTWTSFVNQLTGQLNKWRDEITPAVVNWETQTAQYNNFYTQWKTNAVSLKQRAKADYDQKVEELEVDKSKWIVQMRDEEQRANVEWNDLSKKINNSRNSEDISALLATSPKHKNIQANAKQDDDFLASLSNLQNEKFDFKKVDFDSQVANILNPIKAEYGIKPVSFDGSLLEKFSVTDKKFTSIAKSFNPFVEKESFSIFQPDYKAPDELKLDMGKTFNTGLNGVQNLAYVNASEDYSKKLQEEYQQSILNQYQFTFKQEEMDRRLDEKYKEYLKNTYKVTDETLLQKLVVYSKNANNPLISNMLKADLSSYKNVPVLATNERDMFFKNYIKGDNSNLLTDAEKKLQKDGSCSKNPSLCAAFYDENKDFKSARLENGQLVIVRRISNGEIGKGGDKEGQEVAGGYRSGMQDDEIKIDLTSMGAALKNPKELFTTWLPEDYMAIADNISKNTEAMYDNMGKDMGAVSNGIDQSQKRGDRFLSQATAKAETAVKNEEMVKDLVVAYLTGGGVNGIKSMIKDKIQEAVFEKVAQATGMDPQLVKFAFGKFNQAKVQKRMDKQMGSVNKLAVLGPVGAGIALGANLANKFASSSFGQSMMNTMGSMISMQTGGLINGNKLIAKNSMVANRNKLNELKNQERSLVQNAVGTTVAVAAGRPDLAGQMGQFLGGIKKRQESKRNAGRLDKQLDKGLATATNMVSGMATGIIKNAVVAFGGSSERFSQMTASPFVNENSWRGADKIDTSKEGLIGRVQEMAVAQALENAGMDKEIAGALSGAVNGKIKAKKAKKEERVKAIEATAQTAVAIAGMVVTAGGAAPALGTVLTGGANASFYAVQGANIAVQAAIGSRTGGAQGALAGVVNGTLQALAATNFGALKEGTKMTEMADELQSIAQEFPTITRLASATNISYSRQNGWGIKVNAAGAIGVQNISDFSIGNNRRTGMTLSAGLNTPIGNIGANYSQNLNSSNVLGQRQGATVGASVDVVSINPTGSNMNLGVTLNYDNQEGLSTDVELGFTNNPILQSLGLNVNIGSSGASGSMTQNGGTMGTVDQDGNYEANENFLGEISGHDIAENNGTLNAQNDSDRENDSDNPRESEPQVDGLIPFLIGTGVSLVTAAATAVATAVAGSSTSSGSGRPTSGSSGQGGSVVNPVRPPKKREGEGSDGDSIGSGEGSGGDSIIETATAEILNPIIDIANSVLGVGNLTQNVSVESILSNLQNLVGNLGATLQAIRFTTDSSDTFDGDDTNTRNPEKDTEADVKPIKPEDQVGEDGVILVKDPVKDPKVKDETKPPKDAKDPKNERGDKPNLIDSILSPISDLFGNADPKIKLIKDTKDYKFSLENQGKIPDIKDIKNPITTPEQAKKDYNAQKEELTKVLKDMTNDKELIKLVGEFKIENSKLVDKNGKELSKDKRDLVIANLHEGLGKKMNIHLAKMMAINNAVETYIDAKDKAGKPIKILSTRTTKIYGEIINLNGDFSKRTTIQSLNLVEGRVFGNYAAAIKMARAEGLDIREIKVNSTFRGGGEGHEGEALDVRSITINKDGKEQVIVLDSKQNFAYPPEVEKFHKALLAQPGANFLWTPWKMFNVDPKTGKYPDVTNSVLRLMNNAEFKTAAVEYNNQIDAIKAKQKEIIAKDKLITEVKNDEDKIKKLNEEKTILEEEKKALEKAKKEYGDNKNATIDPEFANIAASSSWDHQHHDHYNLFKAEKNTIPKGKKDYENDSPFHFNPSN